MLPLSGSSTPPSSQNTAKPFNSDPVGTQAEALSELPVVREPSVDRMAFNDVQYQDVDRAVLGYLEGKRVSVTYFQNLDGDNGDYRANIADTETERSLVHTAYRKILNFELTVPSGFTYDYDSDNATATMNWEAYVYPGFNPMIGDVVLAPIGDNKVAYLKVADVYRPAWTNESVYRIQLAFISWPDSGTFNMLDESTKFTVYFDKTNYLGGTASLLKEDRYVALNTFRQMRPVMATYFRKVFYSDGLNSYVRPDGLYDPYVVRFMNAIASFEDTGRRAQQLYPDTEATFGYTVWSRMLDRFNIDLADLKGNVGSYVNEITSFNAGITTLINRGYVLVSDDPDATPYVFGAGFYSGNVDTMTPFETMVYTAITTKSLTTFTDLTVLVRSYLTLSKTDQFYRLPIYLYLMRVAEASIARVV